MAKRSTAYYASHLSENILVTPPVKNDDGSVRTPGYLVCLGAVIARTGWQTYSVRELPQEAAEELGISVDDWGKTVDLYRPPEAVFDPETIQSFENMPVTDNHPPEFVGRDNWKEYACGHVFNVRKGDEALESGDWPLIADILINVDPLATDVEMAFKRELSCGYDYVLIREGGKLMQVGIKGNHVAVVPKGRAGAEARINDAALEEIPVLVTEPVKAPDGNSTKEKTTVKIKDRIAEMLGLALRVKAADTSTTPQELGEFAQTAYQIQRAVDAEEEDPEEKKKREAKSKDESEEAERKKTADAAVKAKDAKDAADAIAKAKDAKGKDAKCMPGEDGHEKCTAGDCMATDGEEEEKARRKKMHESLDFMLDDGNENLGKLKEMFGTGTDEDPEMEEMEEEGMDSLSPVGEVTTESQFKLPANDEDEEEEKEMKVKGNDALYFILPAIEQSKDKRLVKALDAAPVDNERDFLMAMRPAVARTSDKAVRTAYDAALRRHLRTSKVADGSYRDISGGASRLSASARDQMNAGENSVDLNKLQSVYNDRLKAAGGK